MSPPFHTLLQRPPSSRQPNNAHEGMGTVSYFTSFLIDSVEHMAILGDEAGNEMHQVLAALLVAGAQQELFVEPANGNVNGNEVDSSDGTSSEGKEGERTDVAAVVNCGHHEALQHLLDAPVIAWRQQAHWDMAARVQQDFFVKATAAAKKALALGESSQNQRTNVDPATGFLVHVWRSHELAKRFQGAIARAWEALLMLNVGCIRVPYAALFMFEHTFVSVVTIPPLVSRSPVDTAHSPLLEHAVQRVKLGLRIHTKGNISVLMGRDRRFYFLDLGRQFNVHYAEGGTCTGGSFNNNVRLAALHRMHPPYPSDIKQHVTTSLIPIVARLLIGDAMSSKAKSDFVQSRIIVRRLREIGIARRFIFHVTGALRTLMAKHKEDEKQRVADFVHAAVSTEIVSRIIKTLARAEHAGDPEVNVVEGANRLVLLALSGDSNLWNHDILPLAKRKFDIAASFHLGRGVDEQSLPYLLAADLGFKYDSIARKFSSSTLARHSSELLKFSFIPRSSDGLYDTAVLEHAWKTVIQGVKSRALLWQVEAARIITSSSIASIKAATAEFVPFAMSTYQDQQPGDVMAMANVGSVVDAISFVQDTNHVYTGLLGRLLGLLDSWFPQRLQQIVASGDADSAKEGPELMYVAHRLSVLGLTMRAVHDPKIGGIKTARQWYEMSKRVLQLQDPRVKDTLVVLAQTYFRLNVTPDADLMSDARRLNVGGVLWVLGDFTSRMKQLWREYRDCLLPFKETWKRSVHMCDEKAAWDEVCLEFSAGLLAVEETELRNVEEREEEEALVSDGGPWSLLKAIRVAATSETLSTAALVEVQESFMVYVSTGMIARAELDAVYALQIAVEAIESDMLAARLQTLCLTEEARREVMDTALAVAQHHACTVWSMLEAERQAECATTQLLSEEAAAWTLLAESFASSYTAAQQSQLTRVCNEEETVREAPDAEWLAWQHRVAVEADWLLEVSTVHAEYAGVLTEQREAHAAFRAAVFDAVVAGIVANEGRSRVVIDVEADSSVDRLNDEWCWMREAAATASGEDIERGRLVLSWGESMNGVLDAERQALVSACLSSREVLVEAVGSEGDRLALEMNALSFATTTASDEQDERRRMRQGMNEAFGVIVAHQQQFLLNEALELLDTTVGEEAVVAEQLSIMAAEVAGRVSVEGSIAAAMVDIDAAFLALRVLLVDHYLVVVETNEAHGRCCVEAEWRAEAAYYSVCAAESKARHAVDHQERDDRVGVDEEHCRVRDDVHRLQVDACLYGEEACRAQLYGDEGSAADALDLTAVATQTMASTAVNEARQRASMGEIFASVVATTHADQLEHLSGAEARQRDTLSALAATTASIHHCFLMHELGTAQIILEESDAAVGVLYSTYRELVSACAADTLAAVEKEESAVRISIVAVAKLDEDEVLQPAAEYLRCDVGMSRCVDDESLGRELLEQELDSAEQDIWMARVELKRSMVEFAVDLAVLAEKAARIDAEGDIARDMAEVLIPMTEEEESEVHRCILEVEEAQQRQGVVLPAWMAMLSVLGEMVVAEEEQGRGAIGDGADATHNDWRQHAESLLVMHSSTLLWEQRLQQSSDVGAEEEEAFEEVLTRWLEVQAQRWLQAEKVVRVDERHRRHHIVHQEEREVSEIEVYGVERGLFIVDAENKIVELLNRVEKLEKRRRQLFITQSTQIMRRAVRQHYSERQAIVEREDAGRQLELRAEGEANLRYYVSGSLLRKRRDHELQAIDRVYEELLAVKRHEQRQQTRELEEWQADIKLLHDNDPLKTRLLKEYQEEKATVQWRYKGTVEREAALHLRRIRALEVEWEALIEQFDQYNARFAAVRVVECSEELARGDGVQWRASYFVGFGIVREETCARERLLAVVAAVSAHQVELESFFATSLTEYDTMKRAEIDERFATLLRIAANMESKDRLAHVEDEDRCRIPVAWEHAIRQLFTAMVTDRTTIALHRVEKEETVLRFGNTIGEEINRLPFEATYSAYRFGSQLLHQLYNVALQYGLIGEEGVARAAIMRSGVDISTSRQPIAAYLEEAAVMQMLFVWESSMRRGIEIQHQAAAQQELLLLRAAQSFVWRKTEATSAMTSWFITVHADLHRCVSGHQSAAFFLLEREHSIFLLEVKRTELINVENSLRRRIEDQRRPFLCEATELAQRAQQLLSWEHFCISLQTRKHEFLLWLYRSHEEELMGLTLLQTTEKHCRTVINWHEKTLRRYTWSIMMIERHAIQRSALDTSAIAAHRVLTCKSLAVHEGLLGGYRGRCVVLLSEARDRSRIWVEHTAERNTLQRVAIEKAEATQRLHQTYDASSGFVHVEEKFAVRSLFIHHVTELAHIQRRNLEEVDEPVARYQLCDEGYSRGSIELEERGAVLGLWFGIKALNHVCQRTQFMERFELARLSLHAYAESANRRVYLSEWRRRDLLRMLELDDIVEIDRRKFIQFHHLMRYQLEEEERRETRVLHQMEWYARQLVKFTASTKLLAQRLFIDSETIARLNLEAVMRESWSNHFDIVMFNTRAYGFKQGMIRVRRDNLLTEAGTEKEDVCDQYLAAMRQFRRCYFGTLKTTYLEAEVRMQLVEEYERWVVAASLRQERMHIAAQKEEEHALLAMEEETEEKAYASWKLRGLLLLRYTIRGFPLHFFSGINDMMHAAAQRHRRGGVILLVRSAPDSVRTPATSLPGLKLLRDAVCSAKVMDDQAEMELKRKSSVHISNKVTLNLGKAKRNHKLAHTTYVKEVRCAWKQEVVQCVANETLEPPVVIVLIGEGSNVISCPITAALKLTQASSPSVRMSYTGIKADGASTEVVDFMIDTVGKYMMRVDVTVNNKHQQGKMFTSFIEVECWERQPPTISDGIWNVFLTLRRRLRMLGGENIDPATQGRMMDLLSQHPALMPVLQESSEWPDWTRSQPRQRHAQNRRTAVQMTSGLPRRRPAGRGMQSPPQPALPSQPLVRRGSERTTPTSPSYPSLDSHRGSRPALKPKPTPDSRRNN